MATTTTTKPLPTTITTTTSTLPTSTTTLPTSTSTLPPNTSNSTTSSSSSSSSNSTTTTFPTTISNTTSTTLPTTVINSTTISLPTTNGNSTSSTTTTTLPITSISSPTTFPTTTIPIITTTIPHPSLPPLLPPPNSLPLPPSTLLLKLDGPLDGTTTATEATTTTSKAVSGILRRNRRDLSLRRASLASRVAAAALSLISFSVMAADRTVGWAGDSYDRYREYRYCITVNIITFVYSSFQIYAEVHHIMTEKLLIRPPVHDYFDLFFDQMLAYLLISASAAASTRNYDWIVSWGSDPFTVMINGSVSMSYLAFAALAISSLISAHNLFSRFA